MMKTRAPTVAKMMKGEDTPVTFDLVGCIKDLQSMQAEGKRARPLAAAGADDARLHGGVGVEGTWRQGSRDAFGLLGEEYHSAREGGTDQ